MRTISLLLSIMTAFLISTGIGLSQTVTNGSFNGTNTGWDNCGLGSDAVPEVKYSTECYDDATTGTCVQYGDGSGSDNNNCGTGCTGNPSPNYLAEVDQGNSKGLCQNISGFTAGTTRTLYLTLGRRTDFRGGGGAAATQIVQVCIGTACTTITRTSSSNVLTLTTTAWTFTVPASGTLQLKITNLSSYAGPDNGNYGMIFGYIGFSAPAPVTLLDFTAVKSGSEVALDWQTASEKNNHYFVIEKSKDGVGFTGADTIAGAGNSASQLNYHTTDPAPYIGTSYYRLKQVDYDGKFSYSKVVAVENDGLEINIYPNPSQGSFKIDVLSEKLSYQIEVTDMEGRSMYKGLKEPGTSLEVNGLPNGIYVVRVAGEGTVVSRKLVIL
jgi:hypothetical protein